MTVLTRHRRANIQLILIYFNLLFCYLKAVSEQYSFKVQKSMTCVFSDQKWIQVDISLVLLTRLPLLLDSGKVLIHQFYLILHIHIHIIILDVFQLCHHAIYIFRMRFYFRIHFLHGLLFVFYRSQSMRQYRPSLPSPEYRIYDLNKRLSMRSEVIMN